MGFCSMDTKNARTKFEVRSFTTTTTAAANLFLQ